ncbi:MAG TPA: GNAT family N-acetyltransferase [Acidimicrobiales bacterium]|nr:GNAT family N-acetyltransferase [Acidimicrobiales bacterium]
MNAVVSGATLRTVAAPEGYRAELERDVVTYDGLVYRLRPIVPEDAERLVAFHRRLSSHSVYLRFFTFHPELSAKEVERFTHIDYRDRLALVATRDGELMAVGRYDRTAGTEEAEVAFVVADDFQHHGIGSLLLDALADAARAVGITAFKADTLAENRAMLDVFRHAGFPLHTSIEYGTVSVRFPITIDEGYAEARRLRDATRYVTAVPPTDDNPGLLL